MIEYDLGIAQRESVEWHVQCLDSGWDGLNPGVGVIQCNGEEGRAGGAAQEKGRGLRGR